MSAAITRESRTFWLASIFAGLCVTVTGTVLGANLLLKLAPEAAWLSTWGFPIALTIGLTAAALIVAGIYAMASRAAAKEA